MPWVLVVACPGRAVCGTQPLGVAQTRLRVNQRGPLSLLILLWIYCALHFDRETVINKLTSCCRRSSGVSYKYSKVLSTEWGSCWLRAAPCCLSMSCMLGSVCWWLGIGKKPLTLTPLLWTFCLQVSHSIVPLDDLISSLFPGFGQLFFFF